MESVAVQMWLSTLVFAAIAGVVIAVLVRWTRRMDEHRRRLERESWNLHTSRVADVDRLGWLAKRAEGAGLEDLVVRARALHDAYDSLRDDSDRDSVQHLLETHNGFVLELRFVESSLEAKVKAMDLALENVSRYREGLRAVVSRALEEGLEQQLDSTALARALAASYAAARPRLDELRRQLDLELRQLAGVSPLLAREIARLREQPSPATTTPTPGPSMTTPP